MSDSEGMPTEGEWLEGLTEDAMIAGQEEAMALQDPTYTHADLLAVIDKARMDVEEWDGLIQGGASVAIAHNAHLDLCAVILDLHKPAEGTDWCDACYGDWPCASAQVVVDALARMGAL